MHPANLLRPFALIIVYAWMAPLLACARQDVTPLRYNIVLLYADDLGYGDVGCYGATRVKTPNIDRLAREGLRFTDAHCGSATCTPSRYAMLTGEYAWRQKGTGVLPGNANLIIKPGRTTLATILHDAGYQTGVIGKWHLGLGDGPQDWNADIKPGPLEIGFDYCFLMPATGDRVPTVYLENHRVIGLDPKDPLKVSFAEYIGDEPTGKDHPELLKMHPSHGHNQSIVNGVGRIGYQIGGHSARWHDEDMADTYVKKAKEFIENHKAEPFFLYFATHDIHVPRMPHRRFVGQTPMGPRGDAIAEFDWCVGEVLASLEKRGLTRKTLVILTSDNGPVVDDGYKDDAREKLGDHKPAGPFRGGKYSIFEGGTRVPFIVRWPGSVKPGTSEALISQVDLLATLAEFVQQRVPDDAAPDSFNVLPALLGYSQVGRSELIEAAGVLGLRREKWKYMPVGKGASFWPQTSTETGIDPEDQLYDLEADPGETKNLAAEHPELTRELSTALKSAREAGRTRPQPDPTAFARP
jgi:arylsulfatase A-like enzyme